MMAVLRRPIGPAVCLALFMGAAACETAKSANPLSPTLAGPMEGVTFTPPKALEPAANQQIRDRDQPFNVVIENAVSTSPRPFKMRVQFATDSNFTSVVWSRDGIEPAEGGQTRFVMSERMQPGRQYYWRVMADDGANQSAWSTPVGFQVLMPAAFGAPSPRSPVGNEQLTTNRPELRVGNGSAQGPVAQAFYLFQVSPSPNFATLIVNEEVPQQGGETALTAGPLANGTTYYWRVRISDGDVIGPWSVTEAFRTVAAPTPGPSPGPGPGPGPAPGGSCVLSTPEGIVTCNRARYAGFMDEAQTLEMLRQVARDLNAASIPGGPWGVLVKTGGHNCHGYSCDIICAGNGSSQQQYDVLGDVNATQYPTWSGPHPTPTIRPCEIQ